MTCRAAPHCQREAQPEDKFCQHCRARLDAAIARHFPEMQGRRALPNCSGLNDLEVAEVLGRYVRAQEHAVSAASLQSRLKVRASQLGRARAIAKDKGWMFSRPGRHGGLVPGDVEVPPVGV